MQGLKLKRIKGEELTISPNTKDIFQPWFENNERWLFIAPHDDDVVIGGGLLLQKAVEEKIAVTVLISSNGEMGYCDEAQKDSIGNIRKEETRKSFDSLGIQDVRWLDFPDGSLHLYAGRHRIDRLAAQGMNLEDVHQAAGFTGLQNSYTWFLREVNPTRVFVMSGADYHPDHQTVYREVLISVFHAQGSIWPELGTPLKKIPSLYEMAGYCNFASSPDIQLEGTIEHLEKKVDSIQAFKSQQQIAILVDTIRKNGPYEYLKDLQFQLYNPTVYAGRFSGSGVNVYDLSF